jgi:hypothetical protein
MYVEENVKLIACNSTQQTSIENSIQGIQSTLDQPKSLLQGNASAHSHSLLTNSGPTRPASNSSSISRNASQDISNEDARVIDQIVEKVINQPFDKEAEGIWEESRVVSRKTLQYASDALRQGLTETPNANQSRGVSQKLDDGHNNEQIQSVVTFEIPGGRKHELPLSAVKNWDVSLLLLLYSLSSSPSNSKSKGMKTALKTIQYPQFTDRNTKRPRFVDSQPSVWYNNVASREPGLIDNDEFDVIDFQGRKVLPEAWAKSVKSGSLVQLRFRDNISWTDGTGTYTREGVTAPSKTGLRRLGLGGVKNKIFGKTASTA